MKHVDGCSRPLTLTLKMLFFTWSGRFSSGPNGLYCHRNNWWLWCVPRNNSCTPKRRGNFTWEFSHWDLQSAFLKKNKKQKHKHSQAAAGPAKGVTAACMEAPYGQPGIRGTKPAAQTSSWSDVSWWLTLAALRLVSADILWRPPDTYLLLSNIPLRSLH